MKNILIFVTLDAIGIVVAYYVLYFTTGKLVNFHHQKIEILE
jgi:hypothetical protein